MAFKNGDSLDHVRRRKMRVPKRHRQALVAKEPAHGRKVNPGHHKPACEGMPEVVKTEVVDPDYPEHLFATLRTIAGAFSLGFLPLKATGQTLFPFRFSAGRGKRPFQVPEPPASAVRENIEAVDVSHQALEHALQGLVDRDLAPLAILGPIEEYKAVLQVNVLFPFEGKYLLSTHAGIERGYHDRLQVRLANVYKCRKLPCQVDSFKVEFPVLF